MAFEVEDNVPVPEGASVPSGEQKYPWASLKVGQSFFVPETEDPEKNLTRLRNRIVNAARDYARKHEGWSYLCMKVDEDRPNPDYEAFVNSDRAEPEDVAPPKIVKVKGVRFWRRPDVVKEAEAA